MMARRHGVSARALIAAASQPLPVGLSRGVRRVPMVDNVSALVNESQLVTRGSVTRRSPMETSSRRRGHYPRRARMSRAWSWGHQSGISVFSSSQAVSQ